MICDIALINIGSRSDAPIVNNLQGSIWICGMSPPIVAAAKCLSISGSQNGFIRPFVVANQDMFVMWLFGLVVVCHNETDGICPSWPLCKQHRQRIAMVEVHQHWCCQWSSWWSGHEGGGQLSSTESESAGFHGLREFDVSCGWHQSSICPVRAKVWTKSPWCLKILGMQQRVHHCEAINMVLVSKDRPCWRWFVNNGWTPGWSRRATEHECLYSEVEIWANHFER